MAALQNKQAVSGVITRIGPLNGASRVDIQFMLEGYGDVFIVYADYKIGLAKIGDRVRFVYKNEFIGHGNVDHKSFVIENLDDAAKEKPTNPETLAAIKNAKKGNTTGTTLETL